MRRIVSAVLGALALVAFTLGAVTQVGASPFGYTKQLTRAHFPLGAGPMIADSLNFILEGNSGSAPTCNDTTSSFYVGKLIPGANTAATTNATPFLRVTVSGVPTGVAVDTIRAFIDYSMTPNGPWLTAGQAVPTGWDLTLLMVAPTAASDTVGAGATYASGRVSSLSSQPCYTACLNLTGVTAGSANTSPVGWQYARLRLTGDKTTGTLSSLLYCSVWVSVESDVAPTVNPGDPSN